MANQTSDGHGLSPEINKLSKQLSKDPRSKAFIPLAEEYVKAGMLQEAAQVLEDGLQVFPSFITALVALGRVYVQLDLPAKAREVLEGAVKISADNILAHRLLARIYTDEGATESAYRSCEMVLFSYPQDKDMIALKSVLDSQSSERSPQVPLPSTQPAHTLDQTPSGRTRAKSESATSHPRSGVGDTPIGDSQPPPNGVADPTHPKIVLLQQLLHKVRARRAS